jgi:hypothetical protein
MENMAKMFLARHIYLSLMKSLNTDSYIEYNSYGFVSTIYVENLMLQNWLNV